jgi:hypothetical protein
MVVIEIGFKIATIIISRFLLNERVTGSKDFFRNLSSHLKLQCRSIFLQFSPIESAKDVRLLTLAPVSAVPQRMSPSRPAVRPFECIVGHK